MKIVVAMTRYWCLFSLSRMNPVVKQPIIEPMELIIKMKDICPIETCRRSFRSSSVGPITPSVTPKTKTLIVDELHETCSVETYPKMHWEVLLFLQVDAMDIFLLDLPCYFAYLDLLRWTFLLFVQSSQKIFPNTFNLFWVHLIDDMILSELPLSTFKTCSKHCYVCYLILNMTFPPGFL